MTASEGSFSEPVCCGREGQEGAEDGSLSESEAHGEAAGAARTRSRATGGSDEPGSCPSSPGSFSGGTFGRASAGSTGTYRQRLSSLSLLSRSHQPPSATWLRRVEKRSEELRALFDLPPTEVGGWGGGLVRGPAGGRAAGGELN